ncbi:helix-turn-helix domain-containing protein [Ramlibacter henchirensis]|uniref:helix-turn-helix domain-containing protein n=1 Tax=Ramlibacter henchirensis TaxID=204072 RepID=UPI0014313C55|nr:AraC family transcriptional regulator [Ramlibacter henchirensis]
MEVLSLEQLRSRAKPSLFEAPQRVDFHHLLLIQEGRAEHMVDFVTYGLRPGAVLLVRPGQVQQWKLPAEVQGQLALISSEALSPSVARTDVDMHLLALAQWPAFSQPSRALFRAAVDDIGRLAADVERFEGTDVEAAIIRHELLTLLMRLARELRSVIPHREATRDAEIYALFQKELEATYAKRLSVLDYARRLGFSESTLSRACVATVGRTAKAEVDGRVVLEAKRLLVHSQYTAVQIAHQLGFTEPTNFLKFFKRGAGCTPLEFRQAHTIAGRPANAQNKRKRLAR